MPSYKEKPKTHKSKAKTPKGKKVPVRAVKLKDLGHGYAQRHTP
jgi:hypothetical protein